MRLACASHEKCMCISKLVKTQEGKCVIQPPPRICRDHCLVPFAFLSLYYPGWVCWCEGLEISRPWLNISYTRAFLISGAWWKVTKRISHCSLKADRHKNINIQPSNYVLKGLVNIGPITAQYLLLVLCTAHTVLAV